MAFEKVGKYHPDKKMDCIGGAIIDLGYKKNKKFICAGEGIIGHNECTIILETNTHFTYKEIYKIVSRIAENDKIKLNLKIVKQDKHLAKNQEKEIRCGDNGQFLGCPITREQKKLTNFVIKSNKLFPYDSKFILNEKDKTLICCQSNVDSKKYKKFALEHFNEYKIIVNPLGNWTGGTSVDTGATNRKLGSDMGDAVTGGGLHFKDVSKADVSVNIYCHLLAQKLKREVKAYCAIGDTKVNVDGKLVPYKYIVEIAKNYIKRIGGFEKLAEWGILR